MLKTMTTNQWIIEGRDRRAKLWHECDVEVREKKALRRLKEHREGRWGAEYEFRLIKRTTVTTVTEEVL